jgi:tetratricopeptide (TPR) repeat protein
MVTTMHRKAQSHLFLSCIGMAFTLASSACAPSYAPHRRDEMRVIEREKDPERIAERAESWAAAGEPGRAAQYFELAIACGAPEPKIFPRLLVMLVRDRQYQAAMVATENHVRLRPGDFPARLVMASLYASLGNFALARREYETILQREPTNPDAHYSLAVILRDEQGDALQADRHFREYLKLAPEGPHAEQARGLLLQSVQ